MIFVILISFTVKALWYIRLTLHFGLDLQNLCIFLSIINTKFLVFFVFLISKGSSRCFDWALSTDLHSCLGVLNLIWYDHFLNIVLRWTVAFDYLNLIWMSAFILACCTSSSCNTCESCLIWIECVLILLNIILKFYIVRLDNLLNLVVWPSSVHSFLILTSSALNVIGMLQIIVLVSLISKVKIESSINYIYVTTDLTRASFSDHLAYILRISCIRMVDSMTLFHYILIVTGYKRIWRSKANTFTKIKWACSLLLILINSFLANDLIIAFATSVTTSTIKNLILIEWRWSLMIVCIICSIWQKVMINITKLTQLLWEMTTILMLMNIVAEFVHIR